jgi:hypothetical protein
MIMVKKFVDELAKHKLLVYFVTLWGATLFLDTVYGLTAWGLDGFYWVGTSAFVDVFFHFSELFAGIILAILGLKLLRPGFLETLRNENLLVYFLMLWAASFFFRGIWSFVYYGLDVTFYPESTIALLSNLASLIAGVAMGLFSWKMLSAPDMAASQTPPPPPPPQS